MGKVSICFLLAAFLVAIALPVLVKAEQAQSKPDIVEDVDISPLVDFLSKQVYTVTQPFLMFHWVPAKGFNSKAKGPMDSTDPLGYQYVTATSESYLKFLGQPSQSMYGAALYAAVDPVVTEMFGGGFGSDGWVLVQMKIPVGFRMFNLRNAEYLPSEVQNVVDRFSCGSTFSLDQLLSPSPTKEKPCLSLIKLLLRDRLKLDGFLYFYSRNYFKSCDAKSDFQASSLAMVLVSSRWVEPSLVRVFNRLTTDASEDRFKIESLFHKTDADISIAIKQSPTPEWAKFIFTTDRLCTKIAAHVEPTANVEFCFFHYDWSDNTFKLEFHDFNTGSKSFTFPSFPHFDQDYPVVLGQDAAYKLHWNDLKGKTAEPEIDSWIKQNILSCSDQPQYAK